MKMKKKIFGNDDDIQTLNKIIHFCRDNYNVTHDKTFCLDPESVLKNITPR